jgi:DNA-binding response OmpR family regulator
MKVLIIEDSYTDTLLFMEAIRECDISVDISVDVSIVSKWGQARHFLMDESLRLILLDLNLSEVSGKDIITLIRGANILLPIVVFSTSSSYEDIVACYRAGANAYIVKPYDIGLLFDTMCSTLKWWLNMNKLPNINPYE